MPKEEDKGSKDIKQNTKQRRLEEKQKKREEDRTYETQLVPNLVGAYSSLPASDCGSASPRMAPDLVTASQMQRCSLAGGS